MSQQVLLELKYELNQWQRLIPHLWLWFPYLPIVLGPLLVPFFISVSGWYILVVLPLLCLTKNFYYGLLNVMIFSNIFIDIVVEENQLGYIVDGCDYRRWLLLSDVLIVSKSWSTIWTVYFFNGEVVSIPTSAISKEQLEVFCSAVYRATQGRANINWDCL